MEWATEGIGNALNAADNHTRRQEAPERVHRVRMLDDCVQLRICAPKFTPLALLSSNKNLAQRRGKGESGGENALTRARRVQYANQHHPTPSQNFLPISIERERIIGRRETRLASPLVFIAQLPRPRPPAVRQHRR